MKSFISEKVIVWLWLHGIEDFTYLRGMMLSRNERCTLAWFKLAELVARREKERALVVYRLLIHSWNDRAYALQLKGDLLAAFQDEARAREAYYCAVEAYEQSGRILHAAFLYEQLISHQEHTRDSIIKIVNLFALAGKTVQLSYYAPLLCEYGMVDWLEIFVNDASLPHVSRVYLQGILVQHLLDAVHTVDRALVQRNIHAMITSLLTSDRDTSLAPFLAKLAATDRELHQCACGIIEQSSLIEL